MLGSISRQLGPIVNVSNPEYQPISSSLKWDLGGSERQIERDRPSASWGLDTIHHSSAIWNNVVTEYVWEYILTEKVGYERIKTVQPPICIVIKLEGYTPKCQLSLSSSNYK